MSPLPAYERDPYLERLEVEIVRAGEDSGRPYAVLDDTVLYPEGGGQPADRGRLGDREVLDVQKVDGEIRHYLAPGGEPEAPSSSAVLVLDWPRRYDHMQQHTAQHLISALALEKFGWATRSFHLGEEVSDVELDPPELPAGDLRALEEAVAAEVAANRPVTTRRVTPEDYAALDVRSRGLPDGHSGDIRLVEIEGVDLNTCGGTHLRRTREVECVAILGTERLRGGHRVRWVAGGRVRRRLAAHEARAAELRRLFDSDDAGLAGVAAGKLEQLAEARRRIRKLETELATARAESLAAAGERGVGAHFDDADGGFLQLAGRAFVERAPAKACLLTATGDKGSFFLLAAGASCPLDVRGVGAKIAEILEGRGGGSGSIFQGKAGSLARRAEAEALLIEALPTDPA